MIIDLASISHKDIGPDKTKTDVIAALELIKYSKIAVRYKSRIELLELIDGKGRNTSLQLLNLIYRKAIKLTASCHNP